MPKGIAMLSLSQVCCLITYHVNFGCIGIHTLSKNCVEKKFFVGCGPTKWWRYIWISNPLASSSFPS